MKNKTKKEVLKEFEEGINDLAWKTVPLPDGCSNCWGDLHQKCTDECKASNDRHARKIKNVKKTIKQFLSQAIDQIVESVPDGKETIHTHTHTGCCSRVDNIKQWKKEMLEEIK